MAVLREVHFIERRGRSEEIPESAAKIYEKNDTFRDYINNLDLTVKWYNKVCLCYIIRLISIYQQGRDFEYLALKRKHDFFRINRAAFVIIVIKHSFKWRCLFLLYIFFCYCTLYTLYCITAIRANWQLILHIETKTRLCFRKYGNTVSLAQKRWQSGKIPRHVKSKIYTNPVWSFLFFTEMQNTAWQETRKRAPFYSVIWLTGCPVLETKSRKW